jgi:CRISPR system Cascade subunit CasB
MATADLARTVEKWWQELKEDNRGDLARLRRCANLAEVAFVPAYHRLRKRLPAIGEKDEARLMTVAALVSHVKESREHTEDQRKITFSQQMGMPKSEGGNASVSGLRFRRLLQYRNHEELFPALVRIVCLLDRKVYLHSLVEGAYWWNDRTKKQWAYDYYEAAPDEK